MWQLKAIPMLVLLCACGGKEIGAPERVSSTETRLYATDLVDGRREFEEAIVGHRLKGDGMDVTIAPGGTLAGLHLGRPFAGSWEYRRGKLCVSMTEMKVRRARDRTCFHAATHGREVFLVPIEGR